MKQSNFLYLAGFFLLLSCTFSFQVTDDQTIVKWFWEDKTQVPIILVSASLICIGIYFFNRINSPKKKN